MNDALSKILDDIHLKKSEYRYIDSQGEWAFRLEQHAAIIIYVVLEGEMFLHAHHHAHIHINKGDIILLPSGLRHNCSYSPHHMPINPIDINELFGCHEENLTLTTVLAPSLKFTESSNRIMLIRCHIDSLTAKPLLNALPEYLHLHSPEQRTPEWLQIGLSFLALETQQLRPGRDKIIDHLLSILFIQCLRNYIEISSHVNNWLTALSHPQLSSALGAIHSHPEHNWTVESLASECCMSRSKFASVFHEKMNITPLAYLQQHRLKLACQFLRDSQLSMKQIASRIGYSDPAFSQSFKKHFNMSPSQYRSNFQNDTI